MTDDKKHDDKDREKVSDEEMEDVAGGFVKLGDIKGEAVKKKKKPSSGIVGNPYPSP
jgi:hypothetical protein